MSNVINMVYVDAESARWVLDYMKKIILKYKIVTLADFYNLCGLKPAVGDDKYFWTDLSAAKIIQKSSDPKDGFVLSMPPANNEEQEVPQSKQTIRIHIFPTQPLEFEIPWNEHVLHTEVIPEKYVYDEHHLPTALPERIYIVTTTKQR